MAEIHDKVDILLDYSYFVHRKQFFLALNAKIDTSDASVAYSSTDAAK